MHPPIEQPKQQILMYARYKEVIINTIFRAAMITGCYPGRSKVFGAHGPNEKGLDPKFATMGEVLKNNGYSTAVFGKWHLGDQPDTRPEARGFD